MRHRHRASAARVIALVGSRGYDHARSDLRFSIVLLFGALALLIGIVGLLVLHPETALSPSNVVAARWLIAVLGLLTGILAFVTVRRLAQKSAARNARRITLDPSGIRFDSPHRKSEVLMDFEKPLGMTLLANGARSRLVLAITSASGAVYFASRLTEDERTAHESLLMSACTVSDDDAVLEATGPDGGRFELRMHDMGGLVTALLRFDRHAFERCFLSDTRGAPVVLDGPTLRIGANGFDLRAPLEWKATLFQEPFRVPMPHSDLDSTLAESAGVMVYQATWVRQGTSEAVLVSLLATLSSVSQPHARGEASPMTSAVLRDLRLMQATPDAPPPKELRVGIERMFMMRLRTALDRAPRASRKWARSRAAH